MLCLLDYNAAPAQHTIIAVELSCASDSTNQHARELRQPNLVMRLVLGYLPGNLCCNQRAQLIYIELEYQTATAQRKALITPTMSGILRYGNDGLPELLLKLFRQHPWGPGVNPTRELGFRLLDGLHDEEPPGFIAGVDLGS